MDTCKHFPLALFLLWFAACAFPQGSHKPATRQAGDAPPLSLKNALADSLNHYAFLDEYTLTGDSDQYVLHGLTVNNKKAGIIAITNSNLFLYQGREQQLRQTDSIPFDDYAYSFELTNLNDDSRQDLIVHGAPDIHGQTTPYVFMADSNGRLHYRPDLQLPNIRYNHATKMVESYYESCAACVHTKAVYVWDADSLKPAGRAELDLSDNRQITTRVYKIAGGGERKVLDIKDADEQVYDTVFFRMRP